MRGGRRVVFLSCSEFYRTRVADPIKAALARHNIDSVIVTDEPLPTDTDWDPDAKIDKLLEQSDAVVVLATPDDELRDGRWQVRQNVVDEISRARQRPGLRHRILVLKAADVKLHSNINPTYKPLNPDAPADAVPDILDQLRAWGITVEPSRPAASTRTHTRVPGEVLTAIAGLRLGDIDEAERRAYRLATGSARTVQQSFVRSLTDFILSLGEDDDRLHPAMSLLEALGRLDCSLIGFELVEQLARAEDFSKRSCAAQILWDLALASPGDVPLGLLASLAQPASEDWYVQAPAMAAAKELLLVRPAAAAIFEGLGASLDGDDRMDATLALIDIAAVDKAVVPRRLVKQLSKDVDADVAKQAKRLRKALSNKGERRRRIGHFGL